MSNQSSLRLRHRVLGTAASIVGATALALASLGAHAAPVTYVVELSPDNQVPPVEGSDGIGSGLFVFDTEDNNAFSWLIQFSGLSGPATAAHIHQQPDGTVPGEANGDVVVDLNSPLDGAMIGLDGNDGDGTLLGSAEFPGTFATGLSSNLWYVNIHTEANPGGEIRGQILVGDVIAAVPLPAAAWLMLSGLGLLGFKFRRRRA